MWLVWETKQNTTFPYLWCHGCSQPLDAGLSISCEDDRSGPLPRAWMRLCLSCIDKLNSYLRKELTDGLATPSSNVHA